MTEKEKRRRTRISKKKKKIRKTDIRVIDLTEADYQKTEQTDEEVDDYKRGFPFMLKKYLDCAKIREILRDMNTSSLEKIIRNIQIDVRCVKFKGEEAVQVPGFGKYEKDEQRIAFILKLSTPLCTFRRLFPMDMEEFLTKDIFLVQKFLGNINKVLTDPNHPSSIRNIFSQPQRPQNWPSNLEKIGQLEAGKNTFDYFEENLFEPLKSMKSCDQF